MEDIKLKVGPLLDGIIVYEENLAENTKNKNLTALKAKKEFDLIYNKLNEEIEAMEALEDKSDKNMSVESFIHDLAAVFGELKKACNKLKDALKAAGKGEEDSKDANYDKEHADYYDLDKKLKTCEQDKNIIKAEKAPVKEIKDSDKTALL